jgi:polar amino acid transport system substrate-binding protein
VVRRLLIVAAGLAILASPARTGRAQEPSAAARDELAPTGALRVVLLVGNPVLVAERDGELSGVSVDLGRRLAVALGVAFVPVRYSSMTAILAGGVAGEWDVAFIAHDPARTQVSFTPAYMEVDNTVLVPAGSPIRGFGDLDQPGRRIAVGRTDAADLHLSRTLRQAQLFRGTHPEALAELVAGRVDAYAANRHRLEELAATLPGSRVLDGWFLALPQAIAVPPGRPAGLAFATEFVETVKARGVVGDAIDRAGVRGARVAPATPR